MRVLITPLVTLAALLQSCVGSPTAPGATSPGRLVITLKGDVPRSSFLAKFTKDNIRRVTSEWDIINGFSGAFDEETVLALRGSQEVLSIEEDGLYHATAIVTQNNAPWGLSRLSAPEKLKQQTTSWTNYSYTYDNSAGSGVDIYVAANIIAVKVLGDAGSGTLSDIVSGLNWVSQQSKASGKPSVALLSLAGGASVALDNAVTSLTNSGVSVVVSAGDQSTTISSISPARVPSVISVGSTTIADTKVASSNYGNVTTHAPGQSIVSAWNTGDVATNTLSGTSTSAAYVAGIVAYFISLDGATSPAAITAKVIDDSLINYISGMRKSFVIF
ncbi:hypothetical protein H1R20_g11134, partial [Candolleomyces eurysporus]